MCSLDARDLLKRSLMTQVSLIFVIRNYLSGLISKCMFSDVILHHNFLTKATFTSAAGRHVCLVPAVWSFRAHVVKECMHRAKKLHAVDSSKNARFDRGMARLFKIPMSSAMFFVW